MTAGNTFPDWRSTIKEGNTRKYRKYVFFGLVVAILLIFIYLSAYAEVYFREHYDFVNYSPVLIIFGLLYLLLTIVWTTCPGKFKVKPNIKDIRIELMSAFVLISGGLLLHFKGPVYETSFSETLILNTVFVSLIIIFGYTRGKRR